MSRYIVSRTVEPDGAITTTVDAPTMDVALAMFQVIRMQDTALGIDAVLGELSDNDDAQP